METNNTKKLIEKLENKGLTFLRGDKSLFKNYDYYQTINAYKNLFISKVETITDIQSNILNDIDIIRYQKIFNIKKAVDRNIMFREICIKILKKYGLDYDVNQNTKIFINKIEKIKYINHVYDENTIYNDFIRMYKFEHELRLCLLKYTLIIEENIKNIFISTLNDHDNITANFLADINNYNTEEINNNKSLESLKLIIDKHGNKHSKPIQRKRQQNIIVPYWILINELAMNQTYKTIDNLKYELKNTVFQKCLNHFTNIDVNIFDKTKNIKKINIEKKYINDFKIMLFYIGEFRNMLAHNQPIYCYNIDGCSLENYPNLKYTYPSNNKKILNQEDKYNITAAMMHKLKLFFGTDGFNSRNKNVNIDLSWIIYLIYKMIYNIDKNTNFYNELRAIYIKYNIVLSEYSYSIKNCQNYSDLLVLIQNLKEYDLDSNSIIDAVKSNQSYHQLLKDKETKLNKLIKEVTESSEKLKVNKIRSKYPTFPFNQRYKDYTNIDISYFNKIK